MSSLNKVQIIGNLGADPEIRTLQSGNAVANFRVACSETWNDKQTGERREKTEWIPVVVFNDNLVKIVERYLSKGSKVYVEGKWQTRKWQDQSGADRYSTEVVIQAWGGQIVMLGGGKRRDDDDRGGEEERMKQTGSATKQRSVGEDIDDAIPFMVVHDERRRDLGQIIGRGIVGLVAWKIYADSIRGAYALRWLAILWWQSATRFLGERHQEIYR